MSVCGDNRFEIIDKAKKALIDSTNIEQSWDEMEVLDDFLFRCWQMGWLDKYDTKKYISEKECGDCDIWKRLKWYESQDLIKREDVIRIVTNLVFISRMVTEEIEQIPKAEQKYSGCSYAIYSAKR